VGGVRRPVWSGGYVGAGPSLDGLELCEWFALCDRPAVGTVWHPVLGSVPVCGRCVERLGLELEGGAS